MEKVFRRISQISQKCNCAEVSFIKAAGLQASNFVKKRLRYRCFSVKFAKRLITTILNNIRERLLLSFDIKNECKLIMNCTARKMKFSIKKFLQQM